MTRVLLSLCLAASLAACATGDSKKPTKEAPLPTEHFAIKVTTSDDQIMLAPHATGLSPAQSSALRDLVNRWRDAGEGVIQVQTPARGGEDVYGSATLIQQTLVDLGVAPDKLQLADYDAGARMHPPIIVGFNHYVAEGPQCGRKWSSFTSSMNNDVTSNFGCAATANMAAMIANPGDLLAPRDEQPSDGDRRAAVLNKYRHGEITSTPKDNQADGTVSDVGK